MRNHQGYYLSKYQRQLLVETHGSGITADMLRKWEMHPNEERHLERRQTYLSMSVDIPANFSKYHKEAVQIMLRQHFDAATAIAELNQIKKHEAKAFVEFHHFGLTLKFIRENRDKYLFNHTSIDMLKVLMEREHKTFQQALDEIVGMEPWLYTVVVDLHDDGLRCGDIRELLTSRDTENIVRNACLEYTMSKDPRWGVSFITTAQFTRFVKNVFHGAMKLGATAQDAWLLTAGQLQQIALAYHFSDNTFWNAPRAVQAQYLMAGVEGGVAPQNIPVFTREYWNTYLSLRTLHHLTSQQAIAEILAACPDLNNEPLVWWNAFNNNDVLLKRNDAKMRFLREHYSDGIRGKDLAGCPFAKNAVKECMEDANIGAVRTLALLNEMETANKLYLLVYSRLGVSLQSISSVDFLHEPTLEEIEAFTALVEIMKMNPDDAFKLIKNKDENTLKKLFDGAHAMQVITAENQPDDNVQRMRM